MDEGELTDNHGRKASFANAINILTSNVGQPYFLDPDLTFEEASVKAVRTLWNQDPDTGKPLADNVGEDGVPMQGFRPELLNRFKKNIFCFNRLEDGTVKLIAAKSLKELNGFLEENGSGVRVEMDDKDLTEMCKQQYDPKEGARIVQGYIEDNIGTPAADVMLDYPETPGTVQISYKPGGKGAEDKASRNDAKIDASFIPEGGSKSRKPSNENKVKQQKPAA